MLEEALGICQAYADNPFAVDDMKYAKEAARILDAEDFGQDKQFIINSDPENQNYEFETGEIALTKCISKY